jgi:splicing factor 3A subunit 2
MLSSINDVMTTLKGNAPETCPPLQFLVESPQCTRTTVVTWNAQKDHPDDFLCHLISACRTRSGGGSDDDEDDIISSSSSKRKRLAKCAYLVKEGKVVSPESLLNQNATATPFPQSLQLRFRIRGGTDRQNRVGSKFGGGGVSSAQQTERERKERLKQLALESIDLAKDPYLVRNHLGSYECKLCLTLHRDEANYLAHTQGKKHQQGLARRAHQEKLIAEQQGATALPTASTTTAALQQSLQRKVRIGRPAYQVFKSRDVDTNQRCLSFELQYAEIADDIQPRHRFMSAFEQRVEHPPNRNYQYLLFAAEPYETVAFKIPNEPIDKGEDRFVTYWDSDSKKFTLTLYFMETTTPHDQATKSTG